MRIFNSATLAFAPATTIATAAGAAALDGPFLGAEAVSQSQSQSQSQPLQSTSCSLRMVPVDTVRQLVANGHAGPDQAIRYRAAIGSGAVANPASDDMSQGSMSGNGYPVGAAYSIGSAAYAGLPVSSRAILCAWDGYSSARVHATIADAREAGRGRDSGQADAGIARHGAGWIARPYPTLEALATAIDALRRRVEREGRDPAGIGVASSTGAHNMAELVDHLPALERAGVTIASVPILFQARSFAHSLELLEDLAIRLALPSRPAADPTAS